MIEQIKQMTPELVKDALKEVYDPEIGLDIVSLGFIYDIKVPDYKKEENKDAKVYIKMTLSSPGCPLGAMIFANIEDKIKEKFGKDSEIELTFDPIWNPDNLPDEIKEKLGFIF